MILWTRVRFSSDPPSSTFYPCKSRVGRAFSLLKTVYKNARFTSSVSRAFSSFTGENGDTEFAIAICIHRGSGKSGKSGIYHKPLRKKSMLRRAKHGHPCPDIPDFTSSSQRHTGFPSREGKLLGAKGLEFPKNSSRGWEGTEQAHSRILRPFPTNP